MIEAFGFSDPGCVRTNNEDYYLLAPKLGLYLVADGMGGAQAGERASRMAGDTVAEFVQDASRGNGNLLLSAITEANRRVIDAADGDPSLRGMGTTLTAALKSGDDMLFANVGDSRAYVYQGGQFHVITEDQTWVQEVGRKLGIAEDALKVHPMRHVLTMAIGVSETVRVHSYTVPLLPDSEFLLSSDGLHGVVSPEFICEILAADMPLESKCHKLVEAARIAGGPDNITAVLLAWKPV